MYKWLAIVIVLFFVILWNGKRNMNKMHNRRGRNFKKKYFEKKKENEEQ